MAQLEAAPKPSNAIFDIGYAGQVPIQTGKYIVTAFSLDEDSEPSGGGIVAEFNKQDDALSCIREIEDANSKHDARLMERNLEGIEVEVARDKLQELINQRNFKLGKYVVYAGFTNRQGNKIEMEVGQIDLKEDTAESKMKERMIGRASNLGLHNFGMDVYVGNYPEGHPVVLEVRGEHGHGFKFVQNFDGNGYATNSQ